MIDELLREVRLWAEEEGIDAVALVGSHARSEARPDSDIDLVILTKRMSELLADKDWMSRFGPVRRSAVEDWGRVKSIRVWYADGPEIEFGIATPEWATDPDEGTHEVSSHGLKII